MTELYRPTLHLLPDDTAGRFRLLREFLRRWHGLDTGDIGRTVARVAEAEASLQTTLPLAVREWIALLDDLDRIGGWSQVLRDSWSLREVPRCPAFSLLVQGEGDCHWGPQLRDLHQDDPPVHRFLRGDGRDGQFVAAGQVAPRVSTWALEFVVSYLHLSRAAQVEQWVTRAVAERLFTRPPAGLVASRVGETRLLEHDGGLIHLAPDGPDEAVLRAYAPLPPDDEQTRKSVKSALHERIDELVGSAEG